VIQAPFLFDDSSSIVDNPAIHSLDFKKKYMRLNPLDL